MEARDAAGNASTTLSVSVDTPDDCYDDLQQFHEEIWQPFMAGDCIACHIQGGQAGGTQLVLEPGMSPEAIAANFETVENLALDKSMGASLLILKPTGQVAHGGGQRRRRQCDLRFVYRAYRPLRRAGRVRRSELNTCENARSIRVPPIFGV